MRYWTARERRQVATLLEQKLTASQIASHFEGRTANAVVGFVHRNPMLKAIGFRHDRTASRKRDHQPSPRQEEVHSWLIGRAPVGYPVYFQYREAMADLGFNCKHRLNAIIAKLAKKRIIERRGRAVVVLRRMEEVDHVA